MFFFLQGVSSLYLPRVSNLIYALIIISLGVKVNGDLRLHLISAGNFVEAISMLRRRSDSDIYLRHNPL